MLDKRCRNINWEIGLTPDGKKATAGQAVLAVMMDVREELQRLNSLLYCPNFTGIPRTLAQIRRNTTKKRKTKKTL